MILVVLLAIGIVGFELLRRQRTFQRKLTVALVTLLLISLTVAGQP